MSDMFAPRAAHHQRRDGSFVRTVRSNAFRMTPDRSLDFLYLRTCAVYRLLKSGRIDKAAAIALANRPLRRGYKSRNYLNATIEIWLAGPLAN